MPSNVGDIVATLGLDGRKWYEESARIGQSTKSLGERIKQDVGGKLAVDTLSSGIGSGLRGAAESVSTALGSYLARFGTLGAVTGVIAGAGISAAVSALMSEKNAFDGMSASVESANRMLDAFVSRQNRLASFEGGLSRIDSTENARRLSDDIAGRIASEERIDKGLLAQENNIRARLRSAAEALNAADLGIGPTWLARTLGFDVPADQIREQITRLESQLDGVRARRLENAGSLSASLNERDRLREERVNIERRERLAEAAKIVDSDPFSSATARLSRIRDLVSGGELDAAIGARSANRIFDEVRRSAFPGSAVSNTANVLGTVEAFASLQASLQQDRGIGQLDDTAKQQLEVSREIRDAILRLAGQNPEVDL